MTITSDTHPVRTDEVVHEPSRFQGALIAVGLLLVIGGDVASFNMALQRYFTDTSELNLWLLTIALSAAAIVLMYEAGQAQAKHPKEDGARGSAGVKVRILSWLMLGFMAFLTRLAAPPEESDSGGFLDGSSGSTESGSLFGGEESTALFGIFNVQENLVAALLLFVLFLGGGIGAYFIGKENYHPGLTQLRRTRRAKRKAERRLRRDERRWERQRTLESRTNQQAAAQAAAGAQLERDQLHAEVDGLKAQLADLKAQLRALPDGVMSEQAAATAAGTHAKEQVRATIAQYRGEPGATSGITGVQPKKEIS